VAERGRTNRKTPRKRARKGSKGNRKGKGGKSRRGKKGLKKLMEKTSPTRESTTEHLPRKVEKRRSGGDDLKNGPRITKKTTNEGD